MIRKFTKKAAIYTVAVMLGISIPVSSFTGVNTVITAEAATTKPSISNKTKSIYVGDTTKISLKNVSKNVKWKTSNKKVATIKVNGTEVTITGKKAGKAVVSATYKKKNYKCTVTVKNKPVSISEKKKTLEVGNSFELTLKNGGAGAKWSTSNKKVASIKKVSNTKYKITAKKKGTANIKVTYKGKTYTCKLTVKYAAKDQPRLSKTIIYSEVGNHIGIDLVNASDNDGKLKWSISDKSIATIDTETTNCFIHTKKNGTATIKVTYEGETYTCKLVVKKIDAKITCLSADNKLRFGETLTLKADGLYGDVIWRTAGDTVPENKRDVILKKNGNTCIVSCGPLFGEKVKVSSDGKIIKNITASGSEGGTCDFVIEVVPMDISKNEVLTKLNKSRKTVKLGECFKLDLGGMEKNLTYIYSAGVVNEEITISDDLVVTGKKVGLNNVECYVGGNRILFYVNVTN